ncbi:MAG: hypothetical protein L3J74_16965 [Bacteroidales bacterium]|nr:hypothetical protein [Bacteroidales bacterium]
MGAGILSHSRIDEIRINIDPDDYAKEFFKKLDIRLQESYVFKRNIYDRRMDFKGSVFRWAWNSWNLFNPITEGEVEFETQGERTYINHKIYFTEIFTIAFIFTIIPLSLDAGIGWRIFVFSLIWLSYLSAYFISVYRFNSFISELLIETNKDARYEFDEEDIEAKVDELEEEYGLG